MMHGKYLIVIAGPTAVGKTSFSVPLAERYGTHIISADSRQVYKEFSIGTSPPPEEVLERIPHHLIRSHSIHHPITAGDFEREAIALLDELFERHELVLLVGGSGLYIKALCEGLDSFPDIPKAIDVSVEEHYAQKGIDYLREYIQSEDPEYYEQVDTDNPRRLLRAVKVIKASSKPFSHFLDDFSGKKTFRPVYIALNRPRNILYRRINRRVDEMMEEGLLEEAKSLHPFKHLRSLQTVGYKELFKYLDGEWSLDTAVEKIKRNTRRYAKRQLTWFRNDGNYRFFHPEKDRESVYRYIEESVRNR